MSETHFPLDESKLPFSIPKDAQPREKILKLGRMITDRVPAKLHGLTADYTVTLDSGKVFSGRKTMICVCNGRWYGGGFNPVPEAEPDDGLLDVLVVEKVNLLQVATVVGHYQKGRYADYPSLIYHARCRSLRIECVKESVVNIDGEAAYTTDAKIELIPQAIRFFYPKGLTYHTKNSQSGHKFAEITP